MDHATINLSLDVSPVDPATSVFISYAVMEEYADIDPADPQDWLVVLKCATNNERPERFKKCGGPSEVVINGGAADLEVDIVSALLEPNTRYKVCVVPQASGDVGLAYSGTGEMVCGTVRTLHAPPLSSPPPSPPPYSPTAPSVGGVTVTPTTHRSFSVSVSVTEGTNADDTSMFVSYAVLQKGDSATWEAIVQCANGDAAAIPDSLECGKREVSTSPAGTDTWTVDNLFSGGEFQVCVVAQDSDAKDKTGEQNPPAAAMRPCRNAGPSTINPTAMPWLHDATLLH